MIVRAERPVAVRVAIHCSVFNIQHLLFAHLSVLRRVLDVNAHTMVQQFHVVPHLVHAVNVALRFGHTKRGNLLSIVNVNS